MSWYLKRQDEECDSVLYLVQGSVCRVGRSACELIIPDPTVSRHHADLQVTDEGRVRLTDRSKFCQTMLNGRMLKSDKRSIDLRANDFISFGSCPREFTLVWKPIVVLTDFDVTAPPGLVVSSIFRSDAIACIAKEEGTPGGLATAASVLGMPLITESYLHVFASIKSGATSLPLLSDFLCKRFPSATKRSELLAKMSVLFKNEKDQQVYEKAVRLAGGTLADYFDENSTGTCLCIGYTDDIPYLPCFAMTTEAFALALIEVDDDFQSRATFTTKLVKAEAVRTESLSVTLPSEWITPLCPAQSVEGQVVLFSTNEDVAPKKRRSFEKVKRAEDCQVKLKKWTSGNGRFCDSADLPVTDENDLFGLFPSKKIK